MELKQRRNFLAIVMLLFNFIIFGICLYVDNIHIRKRFNKNAESGLRNIVCSISHLYWKEEAIEKAQQELEGRIKKQRRYDDV